MRHLYRIRLAHVLFALFTLNIYMLFLVSERNGSEHSRVNSHSYEGWNDLRQSNIDEDGHRDSSDSCSNERKAECNRSRFDTPSYTFSSDSAIECHRRCRDRSKHTRDTAHTDLDRDLE